MLCSFDALPFTNTKMKFLGFLTVAIFQSISCSESKHKLVPIATSCPLLLPVENLSQTVFLDMDVHTHQDYKTCILKNSVSKQSSVVLLNTDVHFRKNVTRSFLMTNYNPNVIIATKYLTPKMFYSTAWRYFVKSNWSLLYIIVTGDSKYRCKNGTMTAQDVALLENIMNTLWHRFQIMRVGVVFPFACQHKMVIYDGKRSSARILYDRSIKLINTTNYDEIHVAIKKSGENLAHGYPMLAGLFYRSPTSIKDCENLHYYGHFNLNLTLGFCGLDGMVMHDILSHLKFNASFHQNGKCDFYGYGSHRNLSGALNCIFLNEIDISFNSRFMIQYSNEQIYYLHYVITDPLCALVKNPGVVPLWHGVFNLFSPLLWALIGAVVVAIAGIMWTVAMINKTTTGAEIMTFWRYLYNSMMTTILGFTPMKAKTLLMLRSGCLLGSVFFLAIYQGHISRVYTTVDHIEGLKTLHELYNSEATLYTCPGMRDFMRNLQNPEDEIETKFFDRAHLTNDDHRGIIVTDPNGAIIERKSDARMIIMEQYTDDHGSPLIDIVDECFHTFYLSYIARRGFPFVEDIQKITERLNEAGLPNMYYKWTQQMLEIPNWIFETNREPRAFSKITLRDQFVAFGILFSGIIASVIVFVAELWIGRRQHLNLYKLKS